MQLDSNVPYSLFPVSLQSCPPPLHTKNYPNSRSVTQGRSCLRIEGKGSKATNMHLRERVSYLLMDVPQGPRVLTERLRGSRRMAVLEGNQRRIQGLDKLGNENSSTSQTVNLCSEGCMCAST